MKLATLVRMCGPRASIFTFRRKSENWGSHLTHVSYGCKLWWAASTKYLYQTRKFYDHISSHVGTRHTENIMIIISDLDYYTQFVVDLQSKPSLRSSASVGNFMHIFEYPVSLRFERYPNNVRISLSVDSLGDQVFGGLLNYIIDLLGDFLLCTNQMNHATYRTHVLTSCSRVR